MKKSQTTAIALMLIALLPIAFAACIKDSCKKQHRYSWYEPVYATKAEVRANIRSNAARPLENTGKMYLFGQYIFLNELDKGIHVIDNSNPSSPKNVAFIDIPGNLDIAAKGNTLYADLYSDLVVIDITNPGDIVLKKIIENQFPYRNWSSGNGFTADNSRVIVDWKRRDTVITENCDESRWWLGPAQDMFFLAASSSASAATTSPIGTGGSMARFTIVGDRLYTVGNANLDVFNISNANDPLPGNRISVGWNIETIYPFRDKLFIGSQTGMFIYNLSNPDAPQAAGQFSHVRSCDPVIVDDTYAYVTLSAGVTCGGNLNELNILKLNSVTDPQLLKTYPLTRPKGLSKAGKYLYICDGDDGLKVFDASDVLNLRLIKTIRMKAAFDVIVYNNKAIVVAADGLYQFDISDINHIWQLSRISVAAN